MKDEKVSQSRWSQNSGGFVVIAMYAIWMAFVLGLLTLASVLTVKTGQYRWLNLLWLILLMSPNLKYNLPRS